ncbi:MAG: phosphomethylpyrimidine synthase ThiC [Candidatus Omnitrophica bacterium]|nr:phosphomethylpyrimidine synthase ThiC [Candidatus Omnitrophota bacterium]
MKTLIEQCRDGKIPRPVRQIAAGEGVAAAAIAAAVARGTIVVPANRKRTVARLCGIGAPLRVKINANLGTSPDCEDDAAELSKLKIAVACGADTIMDLSVGKDLARTRSAVLKHSPVPVGTVPIYEAFIRAEKKYGDSAGMTPPEVLAVLEEQAEAGVDFFTIHCGVTRKNTALLRRHPRFLGMVSRGGALLARWMQRTGQENPFFSRFDDILRIARRYDIVLSLGDGMRPGSVLDSTDRPQLAELKLLGKLAAQAVRAGVQVMIEGPGHIPLHHIRRNIALQKKYCRGAPFYVLGPLVTDIAAGYDHIAAAIGSCVAGMYGADFLCFVTPAEHIRLPDEEDIKLGVIASKIAAHGADLARRNERAWEQDRRMSAARKVRDWPAQAACALDPEKFAAMRRQSRPQLDDVCTMCGKYCSMKMQGEDSERA